LSSRPALLEIGPHGLSLTRAGKSLHALAQPLSHDTLAAALAGVPAAVTPSAILSRRGAVDVSLDNAWARWQVVDLPSGVTGRDEVHALVRARMLEVFGTTAQGWTCAWDARPGDRVLACAIDTALVQALLAWGAEARVRLTSLQPAWLRAYGTIGAAARLGGFAQLRHGWLCMGLWSGRRWLHVRGESLPDAAGLPSVLERRLSLFDGALDGGQLFVQGMPAMDLPRGWRSVASGAAA
jgi:hypothetical protein